MTITRTGIRANRVQTSLWIFLEGEEDNEGCGDGTGWVHADSVDAETAAGDGVDDDVPVDINKSPETKKATERLIDNGYYSIIRDWMIHFSLPISLFCGTSCICLIYFDMNWFVCLFVCFLLFSEFVLVSRILRKIWIG